MAKLVEINPIQIDDKFVKLSKKKKQKRKASLENLNNFLNNKKKKLNGFNKNNCNRTFKLLQLNRTGQNNNGINAAKNQLKDVASNGNFKILLERKRLPIFYHRKTLLNLIRQNDILIVMGETGSGKTTQIPQFIYSAGLQTNRKIAITQPRRVAAISVASRVAKEMGVELGTLVGFSVRFEDVSTHKTKIKFLTDGTLLRESLSDKLLMNYSVIIFDEAHERTINTDVLFGIVKQAQKIRKETDRKPLKIIIMSATMNVLHFSKYFNNCKAVFVEGRTFPINTFHAISPQDDYLSACISTFFKIHEETPADHGVLMFLTGKEEIERAADQIRKISLDPLIDGPSIKVCPLYSAQPTSRQKIVFQPTPDNVRKLVISTNIAETSLTISGIKYVIDSCMAKVRNYHPATGLDTLKVERITKDQCWQRAGRAGRESEGHYYQMLTRNEYQELEECKLPEIQRSNVTNVVIQLLALGINALNFDFIDKPAKELILDAFENLKLLGVIEDMDSATLTDIGKKMTQFPLDPRFSRIILTAENYNCVDEIITIIALLSGESVFVDPPSKVFEASQARRRFQSLLGDHITLLNVFKMFSSLDVQSRQYWCTQNYINMRNITFAEKVRNQLLEICDRNNIGVQSCGENLENIHKCLISGLFMNIAELTQDKKYVTINSRQIVKIHPSSVLYSKSPECLLFTEIVETKSCFLRTLSIIDKKWIEEVVPNYSQLLSNRKKHVLRLKFRNSKI